MRNAKKGFYWGETGRKAWKAWKSGENTGQEAREPLMPCDLKLVIVANLFKSMFAVASEEVYVIERF